MEADLSLTLTAAQTMGWGTPELLSFRWKKMKCLPAFFFFLIPVSQEKEGGSSWDGLNVSNLISVWLVNKEHPALFNNHQ